MGIVKVSGMQMSGVEPDESREKADVAPKIS
jgi:hypothetical protein